MMEIIDGMCSLHSRHFQKLKLGEFGSYEALPYHGPRVTMGSLSLFKIGANHGDVADLRLVHSRSQWVNTLMGF